MKQFQMLLEIVTYWLIGYQCIRISSVIILSYANMLAVAKISERHSWQVPHAYVLLIE